MSKTYKGFFHPKNKEKYIGDTSNIVYRSLWERGLMKWLDENPDVRIWSSETIVVPYICKTDGKSHRYFVDFFVSFHNKRTLLIEVKPEKQTQRPKPSSGKQKKVLMEEVLTYSKNLSKWEAANRYAIEHGWEFHIWTERTLSNLGIKFIRNSNKAYRKKT